MFGAICSVFVPNAGAAVSFQNLCELKDGLLTLRCKNMPLVEVLSHIARVANLEIYLIEAPGNVFVNKDYLDEPLKKVLKRLLKDFNYAVIYASGDIGTAGVRFVKKRTGLRKKSFRMKKKYFGGDPGSEGRQNSQYEGRPTSLARVKTWTSSTSDDERWNILQGGRQRIENELPSQTNRKRMQNTTADGGQKGSFSNGSSSTEEEVSESSEEIVGSSETSGSESFGSDAESEHYDHGSKNKSKDTAAGENNESFQGLDKLHEDPMAQKGGKGDDNQNGRGTPEPETDPATVNSHDWQNDLQCQIDQLKYRIESGASDGDYEKWSSIKGEKYITHDRELLKRYQETLEALLSD
jgi:hypothetical protein